MKVVKLFIFITLFLFSISTLSFANEYTFDYKTATITNSKGFKLKGGLRSIKSTMEWELDDIKSGYYKISCRLRFNAHSEFEHNNNKTSVRFHNIDTYRLILPGKARMRKSGKINVFFKNTDIENIGVTDNRNRTYADVWADGIFYLEEKMSAKIKIIEGKRKSVLYIKLHKIDIKKQNSSDLLNFYIQTDKEYNHFHTSPITINIEFINYFEKPRNIKYKLLCKHFDSDNVKEDTFVINIPPMSGIIKKHKILLKKFGPYLFETILYNNKTEESKEIFFSYFPSKSAKDLPSGNAFGDHFHDWDIFDNTGGLKWTRVQLHGGDIEWNPINSEKDIYKWNKLDKAVTFFESKGLEILYTIFRTPGWLKPDDVGNRDPKGQPILNFKPSDMDEFDKFVEKIATRYKGRIKYWEIWNEPNSKRRFQGSVDDYIPIFQRAYNILKKVDKNNFVVVGALMGNNVPWVKRICMKDKGQHFDALSVHSYTHGKSPEKIIYERFKGAKKILDKHVPHAELWGTEAGFVTPSRDGCRPINQKQIDMYFDLHKSANNHFRAVEPERIAAKHNVRSWLLSFLGGSRKIFYFMFNHGGEFFSGIAPDGSYKLHHLSVMVLANIINVVDTIERVDLNDDDIYLAIVNKNSENPIGAAWTQNKSRTISMPLANKNVKVMDIWGNDNPRIYSISKNKLTLNISGDVIYLKNIPPSFYQKTQVSN